LYEERRLTDPAARSGEPAEPGIPALEWIAAAVGLLLIVAMLGVIGWEATKGHGEKPPAVEVVAEKVIGVAGGYVVEVALRNRSPATAAGVVVEGVLTGGDAAPETSTVTIDYVPGGSTRRAGLIFTKDPRLGDLKLRALGYTEP
jgi:uncharacterized protein (TIGR02588 family)